MVRVTTNKVQIFSIVARVLNDRETRKPFEITKKWSVSVPLMKDAKVQFPSPLRWVGTSKEGSAWINKERFRKKVRECHVIQKLGDGDTPRTHVLLIF